MHMIDTLICIVYIFVGAKWVKKGRNRDDICSNKLENYRSEIFNMVGSAIRNFYIYPFL